MLQADILEALRVQYKLAETEYPDDFLIVLINRASKKISEYYPEKELASMETVAGQTRYTLDPDTHPSLIRLKEVYYDAAGRLNNDFGDPEVKTNANVLIQSTFAPSQTMELIQRIEIMKKLLPSGGEIVSHNKFDLIPTPESVLTVYYEYDRARTLDEIPDLFEEDIFNLVMYYIGEDKVQKFLAGDSTAGNRYTFERRGNIASDKQSSPELVQKQRKDQLKDILMNIQTKVMKL